MFIFRLGIKYLATSVRINYWFKRCLPNPRVFVLKEIFIVFLFCIETSLSACDPAWKYFLIPLPRFSVTRNDPRVCTLASFQGKSVMFGHSWGSYLQSWRSQTLSSSCSFQFYPDLFAWMSSGQWIFRAVCLKQYLTFALPALVTRVMYHHRG